MSSAVKVTIIGVIETDETTQRQVLGRVEGGTYAEVAVAVESLLNELAATWPQVVEARIT